MTRMFAGAIALAFALTPAAALAASKGPAYVGTWGTDAANCKVEQSVQEAPIIMKHNGYDRYETHCKFSGLKKKGDTWNGRESCKVGGSTQRNKIVLKVSGDTLSIDEGPGPRTLQRCQ